MTVEQLKILSKTNHRAKLVLEAINDWTTLSNTVEDYLNKIVNTWNIKNEDISYDVLLEKIKNQNILKYA